MSAEAFLRIVRELATCYQAFERMSSQHIRALGVTPAQFDIIATLGNTNGMTCKELGEKTLITKGTLTGVLDRLEEKLLLQRKLDAQDGRAYQVTLTTKGQRLFEHIFPAHLAFLQPAFADMSKKDINAVASCLSALRLRFENNTRETS